MVLCLIFTPQGHNETQLVLLECVERSALNRIPLLGSALVQIANRLGDAALTRFDSFGLLDCEYMPLLVAIRQPIEEPPGLRISVERVREVGRHSHLARRGV